MIYLPTTIALGGSILPWKDNRYKFLSLTYQQGKRNEINRPRPDLGRLRIHCRNRAPHFPIWIVCGIPGFTSIALQDRSRSRWRVLRSAQNSYITILRGRTSETDYFPCSWALCRSRHRPASPQLTRDESRVWNLKSVTLKGESQCLVILG